MHQKWIPRRSALIQTTLDGAAEKWFPLLPIMQQNLLQQNL